MKEAAETYSIKHWAEEDRPREKLLAAGPKSLSNSELLAIILGSGTRKLTAVELAKYMLGLAENSWSTLATNDPRDWKKIKGIGDAKAVTLCAVFEIARRFNNETPEIKKAFTSSADVYTYVASKFQGLSHEEFWFLSLARNNTVLSFTCLSKGGKAGTVVDVKLLLKRVLQDEASGLILIHNHPSGNTKPSVEDKQLTQKIKEAAGLLDIQLLDHLIVTNTAYLSFADEGML